MCQCIVGCVVICLIRPLFPYVAQQGADPLLQFMTPAGLMPLLYSGFIKDLWIHLSRVDITGGSFSGHSFRQ